MAITNVSNRIKCEHSKECSSYSCWIGDGKSSKCFGCKNNKYQDPEKNEERFLWSRCRNMDDKHNYHDSNYRSINWVVCVDILDIEEMFNLKNGE